MKEILEVTIAILLADGILAGVRYLYKNGVPHQ